MAKTTKPGNDNANTVLKEGQKAPAFTVVDDQGRTVTLGDFKGRKLVLFFYPKDNTSGCTKEACSFRDALTAIRRKGAEVVGVSPDPVKSHQKFKSDHNLTFTLLSDGEKSMVGAYGVCSSPGSGRKSRCTAGSTWVSSALLSSSTKRAG